MTDRDEDWTGGSDEPDRSGGSGPDPTGEGEPVSNGGSERDPDGPTDPGRETDPDRAGASGADGTKTGTAPRSPGGSRGDRSMRTYLLWGALVVLAVLVVVATAGLYSSLSSVITVWIGERYRPIARAVLNFGVLCVAGAGIAVILRRL